VADNDSANKKYQPISIFPEHTPVADNDSANKKYPPSLIFPEQTAVADNDSANKRYPPSLIFPVLVCPAHHFFNLILCFFWYLGVLLAGEFT
jgi:hypothetical protein